MNKPPSVVTSDQPFFDPGTSTSGLSSGVTVGGTGRVSSQPVMRVTGTSSAQTAGCGHTETQQGLPVKQDYRLQRVAGDTQQDYWLHRKLLDQGVYAELWATRNQLQSIASCITV